MLDMSNQRGVGGARTKFNSAVANLGASASEQQLLDEMVRLDTAHRPRRRFFAESPLLSAARSFDFGSDD